MRIGRHNALVSGNFASRCDICGLPTYRRLLIRRRDGLLACPDDASERDPVTLSEGNVAGMPTPAVPRWDGGSEGIPSVGFVLVSMDDVVVVSEEGETVDPTRTHG